MRGRVSRPKWGRPAGFTFAEVLAAMVFMAIVIPVAIQAMRIASRAGVVAERKNVAVQLADSLLNELVVTGEWMSARQSGTFGEEHAGYEWHLASENWGRDNLRLLTIEVIYEVQNREHSVLLSTLVPPEY